jgi:hypothetical protein
MGKTKMDLIRELERSRKVQLTSGKWVEATGFDWENWKKSDVEQLFKGSKKRR